MIVFFAAIVLVVLFLAILRKHDSDLAKMEIILPQKQTFPYIAKPRTLNGSEAAVYHELKRQLPDGFHVSPKMRMADFISTENNDREWIRKIWAKHVDMLVMDRYSKPVIAIEVNGKYHMMPDVAENDAFKAQVLRSAGIPLETILIGETFSDSVKNILERQLKLNA